MRPGQFVHESLSVFLFLDIPMTLDHAGVESDMIGSDRRIFRNGSPSLWLGRIATTYNTPETFSTSLLHYSVLSRRHVVFVLAISRTFGVNSTTRAYASISLNRENDTDFDDNESLIYASAIGGVAWMTTT